MNIETEMLYGYTNTAHGQVSIFSETWILQGKKQLITTNGIPVKARKKIETGGKTDTENQACHHITPTNGADFKTKLHMSLMKIS